MPDTDDHSATPPISRPSLLGSPDTGPRARPVNDPGQMRMLDELEAVVRPRAVERSNAPPGWLMALLAGGVAIAAALWWTNHRGAERPAAPAAVATAPAAAKPASAADTVALAPADAASAPAVIETIAAVPQAPAPPADTESAASPPAAAPATLAARQPARSPTAVAAASPSPARSVAATRKADEKVTTVVTSTGGRWTVTVAEPASAEATAAAAAAPPLANPAASVSRADAGRESKGDDADVKLLSALLAHVARSGPGGALPDEGQITIAQLVKRCDSRPADAVRECRRRICEGYWGKAEACPAPVAAKKG